LTQARGTADASVAAAVADAHRREWAFVLAATVRVTRDLDLAEECVQDAYARALATWGSRGVPANPGAWLTTVARRRGVDLLRRDATLRRSLPLLLDEQAGAEPGGTFTHEVTDDRLRLIFTCCHPAIAAEARVALTLRLLCGLTTGEVARAFLVSEPTMAARITRAKKKIAAARIPYRVPSAAELPVRVHAVLTVVHLLFTTGHTAPAGANLVRRDLVERSLDLARMLRGLLPADADVAGLLALILLTDARAAARVGPAGRLLLLAEQDRAKWDRAAITEGIALVREALRRRPPGRFALMAAIAAVHAEAKTAGQTDWKQIAALYGILRTIQPSPIVDLNHAVAIAMSEGIDLGLAFIDKLGASGELDSYHLYHAARADLLRRLSRCEEALNAYNRALSLTANDIERRYLRRRIAELDGRIASSS